MKKITAAILAVVTVLMLTAAMTAGAKDLPTPTFYYDLVDKKPNGNLDKFATSLSDRKNVILSAVDGDEETSRLFVFADDNTKFADVQYIVVKFRHLRTEVQAYPGELNIVGKTSGEEKHTEVTYNGTEDFQTAVIDLSNTFAGDVHYFTLTWHKVARFECKIEIEYIAGFGNKADADEYAKNFDRHAPAENPGDNPGDNPGTADALSAAIVILMTAAVPCAIAAKKRK